MQIYWNNRKPLHKERIGHFRVASSLCFKGRLSEKPLFWKRFCYYANKSHFHNKSCALGIVLKESQVFELGNGLLNSHSIGLEHKHGLGFIVLEHQYGHLDVM